MSSVNDDAVLAQRVLTMRIIVGALVAGVTVFLVVALVVRASGPVRPAPATPWITYVASGCA